MTPDPVPEPAPDDDVILLDTSGAYSPTIRVWKPLPVGAIYVDGWGNTADQTYIDANVTPVVPASRLAETKRQLADALVPPSGGVAVLIAPTTRRLADTLGYTAGYFPTLDDAMEAAGFPDSCDWSLSRHGEWLHRTRNLRIREHTFGPQPPPRIGVQDVPNLNEGWGWPIGLQLADDILCGYDACDVRQSGCRAKERPDRLFACCRGCRASDGHRVADGDR